MTGGGGGLVAAAPATAVTVTLHLYCRRSFSNSYFNCEKHTFDFHIRQMNGSRPDIKGHAAPKKTS